MSNEISYSIVSKNAEIGQISVLYKHGDESLAEYAIDVPVVDGVYLTGDALHQEIMHRAPTWLIERKAQVATAYGFDLIGAEPIENPADSPEVKAVLTSWENHEFEKRVAAALIKFGVLQSDPTTIQMTQL